MKEGCPREKPIHWPETWPQWEKFAINHADRALYDRSRIELPLPEDVTSCFFAGMLGYSKYRRYRRIHTDAYDAGTLARVVFDERGTLATRVWEVVAASRRKWMDADEVAAVFRKRGTPTVLTEPGNVRVYLNHLNHDGLLECVRMPPTLVSRASYSYRRLRSACIEKRITKERRTP